MIVELGLARQAEEAEGERNGPERNDRIEPGCDQPAVGEPEGNAERCDQSQARRATSRRGDHGRPGSARAARAAEQPFGRHSSRRPERSKRRRASHSGSWPASGCQVSARFRSSQPETAIESPTATSTFSTCERVRSRQAFGPGPESSLVGSGSGVGCMGDRRARSVDVSPQAEDQLDLADGLAGCLGDHLGRGALVGEGPDCGIPLAERV